MKYHNYYKLVFREHCMLRNLAIYNFPVRRYEGRAMWKSPRGNDINKTYNTPSVCWSCVFLGINIGPMLYYTYYTLPECFVHHLLSAIHLPTLFDILLEKDCITLQPQRVSSLEIVGWFSLGFEVFTLVKYG